MTHTPLFPEASVVYQLGDIWGSGCFPYPHVEGTLKKALAGRPLAFATTAKGDYQDIQKREPLLLALGWLPVAHRGNAYEGHWKPPYRSIVTLWMFHNALAPVPTRQAFEVGDTTFPGTCGGRYRAGGLGRLSWNPKYLTLWRLVEPDETAQLRLAQSGWRILADIAGATYWTNGVKDHTLKVGVAPENFR